MPHRTLAIRSQVQRCISWMIFCKILLLKRRSRYGWSIIFTHQELITDSMSKLVALSSSKMCEISAVRVFCLDLTIVSLYRPPSGDFDEFLRIIAKLLNCLDIKKNIILGGHLNVIFNSNDAKRTALLDLLLSYGLKPIVNFNTRGPNFWTTFSQTYKNVISVLVL